ncbi:MAG: hypothetical protein OXG24_09560 [Gammaproteobacteria bacterium]|nr:hypothetical protein [Gammaproteobacteria bacterium]
MNRTQSRHIAWIVIAVVVVAATISAIQLRDSKNEIPSSVEEIPKNEVGVSA